MKRNKALSAFPKPGHAAGPAHATCDGPFVSPSRTERYRVAALDKRKDRVEMDLGFTGAAPDRSSGGTSRIGGDLRAARERLGWDIDAVAEALRLKPAFLRAIEQGDIAGLPAPAYAVGFVRTYATALGLDPNEAIRRFRGERDEVNRKTELAFPAPVPQRGVPAGALILVGAVVAIGGYIGWYHYSGRSLHGSQMVAEVPAHLEPLAPPATPHIAMVSPPIAPPKVAAPVASPPAFPSNLPNEGDVSPSSAAAAVPMPLLAPPIAAAPAVTKPGVANAGAAGSGATPPGTVAALTPPAVQAPQGAPSALGAASVPGVPGPMVIQATADAWIEIKSATGRVVYQTVLHSGDSYTVPNQPQLTLTTGNASATEVVLSGDRIGPLKGHVLRNIPLDADSLRAASGQPAGVNPAPQ
jgi:cytoskeleton protein RodZ